MFFYFLFFQNQALITCFLASRKKEMKESLLGKVIEISPEVAQTRRKIAEAYLTLQKK